MRNIGNLIAEVLETIVYIACGLGLGYLIVLAGRALFYGSF